MTGDGVGPMSRLASHAVSDDWEKRSLIDIMTRVFLVLPVVVVYALNRPGTSRGRGEQGNEVGGEGRVCLFGSGMQPSRKVGADFFFTFHVYHVHT